MIDLHNREVVGHAMAEHMRAEPGALDLAVRGGLTGDGAIIHADRGSQHTCGPFRCTLTGHGIGPPVGRTGSCFGSFFATLKTEIGTTVRESRDDARRDVLACPGYRNHDRLHSTLGYRTPHEARVGRRRGVALVA
ncbi:hypothetical protein GCM10022243_67170 [Saccharothrix violaceirubra]|uniref:Transposase InsO family protein n=1 Tax=Saccharothrix violaceirubra TaxID=413306 RepID=A0A7W7T2D5_9PSEU|nr:hypothetical protein [Saccharothrix violaceirubra]MBB4965332.1 transposase InsO family protein [Saccharothrix violaceirubra]